MTPQFPTLYCRCKDGHQWATLIPKYWFKVTDVQCPVCFGHAVEMKAGDYRSFAQVKEAAEKSGIVPTPTESETKSS